MDKTVVDLTVTIVCLAGLWYFYYKMLDWVEDRFWRRCWVVYPIFAFGAPVLSGVGAGLLFHSWVRGMLFSSPVVAALLALYLALTSDNRELPG